MQILAKLLIPDRALTWPQQILWHHAPGTNYYRVYVLGGLNGDGHEIARYHYRGLS